MYYLNFTIYFANLLFPLFLFLSVIWFTSKLAINTEIVAFLSSGVSYSRFMRPYMIGAMVVAVFALILGLWLAPKASRGYNEFIFKNLKKRSQELQSQNIFRQINDNDYIYVSNFDTRLQMGNNFTFEHFEGNKLKYKVFANTIAYSEQDSSYRLMNYVKRTIGDHDDIIETTRRNSFTFDLEDLTPVEYIAETLPYDQLNDFIEKEKARGSSNIGRYEVVKYKKWSLLRCRYLYLPS